MPKVIIVRLKNLKSSSTTNKFILRQKNYFAPKPLNFCQYKQVTVHFKADRAFGLRPRLGFWPIGTFFFRINASNMNLRSSCVSFEQMFIENGWKCFLASVVPVNRISKPTI